MTYVDIVILGILQGLTEFLPVSSSGHLVIGESLLGLTTPGMSLEIWLHFGTLMAVVLYFRRRLFDVFGSVFGVGDSKSNHENRATLYAILIGTIPASIVGVVCKTWIAEAFNSPRLAAVMLIVTGIMLLSTLVAKGREKRIGIPRGFGIGLAQAFAILPGISRSGSTIACAMFMGVKPAVAAEFSFLLAAPIIALAFGYDLVFSGARLFSSDVIWMYIAGTIVSFIVGLLAIHYLLKIIRTGRFYIFGFYCLVAGVISFIFMD